MPLDKLPAEIVSNLLSIVDTECIVGHRNRKDIEDPWFPLATILAVNKSLRNSIISTPLLWTHVDLAIGCNHEAAYMGYAQSCLRYSGQQLLYVHVANKSNDYKHYGRQAADIVALLTPHAHRIVSISFHLAYNVAAEILSQLFGSVASYQTRELCLNDGYISGARYHGDNLFDARLDTGFLQRLESISIKGPFLPLQSVAFCGLTALKLFVQGTITPPPTLIQLADVLAACPELRALSLFIHDFDLSSGVSINPVLLPKLELLDLRTTDTDELFRWLSFVRPGSSTLTLSICADPYISEDETAILHHFISQSNVTRLLLENVYTASDVSELPPLLTRAISALQELALREYDLHDLTGKYPLHLDRFPSLRTLHLLHCTPYLDNWSALIDSSAIQVVYVDQHCPRSLLEGAPRLVKIRDYSMICEGEGDLEWPLL
ncbi:hypothetical protein FRC12_006176 [Ceratobasidium sp. 428]|nr:hypothetical protein FRC12_006176 [Ceratobasidium sp. 428]